jgi:hypothetical protein
VHNGNKRRLAEKKDTFQYVPLLEGLKSLLMKAEILDEVSVFPPPPLPLTYVENLG